MAGYQTTYSAGMSKMEMAGDPQYPAAEGSDPYVKPDPDPAHPPAADNPHDDRVPWEVVPPTEDPAMEGEPLPDPPAGDTGESVLGIPAKSEKHEKRSSRTHHEGDHL